MTILRIIRWLRCVKVCCPKCERAYEIGADETMVHCVCGVVFFVVGEEAD